MLFGARESILYRTGWYFPFQRVNGYRITSKMYRSKYRLILDCIGLTGGYRSFQLENLNRAGIDLWLSVTPPSLEALTLPAACHSSFSLPLSLFSICPSQCSPRAKVTHFFSFFPLTLPLFVFFFFCALIQSPTKPTWTIKSSLYFKFLLFWLFYKSLFFFICLCYLPTSLSQFHLFSF